MTSRLRWIALPLAAASLACGQAPKNPYRADFELFAAGMQQFDYSDFLYGRRPGRQCGGSCEVQARFHDYLRSPRQPRPLDARALKELLAHPDPKVRTLAAAALYDLEEPRWLPDLFALINDKAATFPTPIPLPYSGASPPSRPMTVGAAAKTFIDFYLSAAGFHYGAQDPRGLPGFREYWEAYRGRAYSASWFAVQLARASGGISPAQAERLPAIRRVRERIDAVPSAADRAWILLYLSGENGSVALVKEDELVRMLRSAAGRQALLRLLSHQPVSPDPALRSRPSNNHPYRLMCNFVLRHATELLAPGDAAFLLGRERWERGYFERKDSSDPLISAWWPVAAAYLQPKTADAVLTGAFARFTADHEQSDRAELALALWRLAGANRIPFLADWLFAEQSLLMGDESVGFLGELARTPQPRDVALLRALIHDARLERLSWRKIEAVVQLANAHRPPPQPPVATYDELRQAWHPMGIDLPLSKYEEARRQYPKETADLLGHLAEWRRRLRAAFPR